MLLKRIIPCLDVDQGRVVKGVRYVDHVDAGDPVEVARLYDEQGADEITFLDITASHEERRIILDVVARTAETVFMPLTVGGGVRTLQDVRDLLNAGADKVSIMTAAVENPDLVAGAAAQIGSANLVVAIDARRTNAAWIQRIRCIDPPDHLSVLRRRSQRGECPRGPATRASATKLCDRRTWHPTSQQRIHSRKTGGHPLTFTILTPRLTQRGLVTKPSDDLLRIADACSVVIDRSHRSDRTL